MAISTPAPTEVKTVSLTIDGREITVPEGTTIWAAAKDAGIEIPVLCHDERYDPVGVCRMCVVDVGARVYAAACVRPCEDGMEVKTATPELERNRAQLTELLLVDQPPVEEDPKETTTADNELLVLVRRYGLQREDSALPRGAGSRRGPLQPRHRGQPRRVHPLRPLRPRLRRHPGQRRHRPRRARATTTRIAFDLDDPMGESSCVTCGECVAACPTGALTNKPINGVPDPPARGAAPGRHGLPVLRRRLRAHVQRRRRARGDRVRRRPPAARLAEPSVRQGSLRLGLLLLRAAAHDAADPA